MKIYFQNERGVSIFIAIGFCGALFLITFGVSFFLVPFIQGTKNIEVAAEAYFAAEAGIEDALYDLSQHTAGYENTNHRDEIEFSEENQTLFGWKIESRVPENRSESDAFTIPKKGEGNSPADRDWNKLSTGESSEIHLFLDDSTEGNQVENGDIKNISSVEFGFERFRLQMRIPENANLLTNEEEESGIQDDTMLTWNFLGEDDTDPDTFHSLREVVAYTSPDTRDVGKSSEIYESKMNARSGLSVLDSQETSLDSEYTEESVIGRGVNAEGIKESLDTYLKNTDIHKPVFKISLVSKLLDTLSHPIPFLEYRILIDADLPIPNEFFTITATGTSGNFTETLVTKVKPRPSLSLLDFVIFQ